MNKQYNNILVHSLVNIGDVVLSTAAVALLRQAYPSASITMMVRPAAAEIACNNPVIDDVLIFDYKAKKRSPLAMLKFIREIASRNYDLCISLDRKLRPALLTMLAGIPVRVGPDRVFDDKPSWVTKLYTHVMHTPADFRQTHQAEIFRSIIRAFSGIAGDAEPVIGRIMPEHTLKAETLLSRLPPAKYKIALCVKGTYPLKNWPPAQFAALLENLAAKYDAAFFVAGTAEDMSYAQELIDSGPTAVANFCGQTSLLELAALLAQADLFITIDTGAMHIGATVKVPTIGFFRCVSANRWRPLTDRVIVLDNHLAPCPTAGPPESCPHHYCVSDIPLSQALAAVEEILSER